MISGRYPYFNYECHMYYDGPLLISFTVDGQLYLAKIAHDPSESDEWLYFAIPTTKTKMDQYFVDTAPGTDKIRENDKLFFNNKGYLVELVGENEVEFREFRMPKKGEAFVS